MEKARLELAKAKMKFHTMMEQSETIQSSFEKAKADAVMTNKQLSKVREKTFLSSTSPLLPILTKLNELLDESTCHQNTK
jgi:hypothetical protein